MCILLLLMALDLVFSDTSTVYRWRLTVGLARMKNCIEGGGSRVKCKTFENIKAIYLASSLLRITIFQQNLLT